MARRILPAERDRRPVVVRPRRQELRKLRRRDAAQAGAGGGGLPRRRHGVSRNPQPAPVIEIVGGSMEFGIFHEFLVDRDASQAEAFAQFLRADRGRRAVGPRRRLARRNPHEPDPLAAVGAADRGERDRRAHQPHQDRHGGADPAARPPAAAGRGDRDDRPDQRRPADLRGRAQRLSARLQRLRHLLRGEPAPLRRKPRDHQEGVDRAQRLASRAAITASKISRWCRVRCSSRIRKSASPPASTTPTRRSASWAIRCSRRCAPARSAELAEPHPGLSRGLARGRPSRASRAPICRCRSMSPRPARRRSPRRKPG